MNTYLAPLVLDPGNAKLALLMAECICPVHQIFVEFSIIELAHERPGFQALIQSLNESCCSLCIPHGEETIPVDTVQKQINSSAPNNNVQPLIIASPPSL